MTRHSLAEPSLGGPEDRFRFQAEELLHSLSWKDSRQAVFSNTRLPCVTQGTGLGKAVLQIYSFALLRETKRSVHMSAIVRMYVCHGA